MTGGTLSLAYERPTADVHPFKDFTGTLVLEQGTSMDAGFKLHNETANNYEYGLGENMTLAMKGAKITRLSSGRGNDGTNNDTLPWLQLEGDNFIVNGTDRNGDGAGVNIRFGKGIKGAGNLTITSKSRSVTLKGSNAGFSGTLTVAGDAGNDPNGLWFEGHATASADAAFVHTRPEYVYFRHNNDDDKVFRLGALVADGDTAGIDVTDAGTTLSIGSKAGTDSRVIVPFVKSAVAIEKVGEGTTLTFGEGVTFIDGTSLSVAAGTLKLDGCDISGVSSTFAPASTLAVTQKGGTIARGSSLGVLSIPSGAKLIVPIGSAQAGDTVTLFSYASLASGTAVTKDSIAVEGLSANAYAASVLADDNGTVTLTVSRPTLSWNGAAGADWMAEGAWSADGVPCTFADGDMVSLKDGDKITLSSAVRTGGMNVSGNVTIAGNGSAAIECGELSLDGTLSIAGSVALNAAATLETGAVNVADGAELVIGSAMTFKSGFKVLGGGGVVFDGAAITLDHSLLTANAPFADFTGTVTLRGGAAVTQTGRAYAYPSDKDADLAGPFGDGASKIVFSGGSLTGFSQANNVFIHNAIEVNDVKGFDNTLSIIHAASDGDSPNVKLYGRFLGSGTLKIDNKWFSNANRRLYFEQGCDMSEFGGTLDFTGTGVAQIGSTDANGENVTWRLNNIDRVFIQPGENTTVRLGAVDFQRTNATGLYFWHSGDDGGHRITLEIGAKNEDCAVNSPITGNNDLDLVKIGAATLTLGTGCTMRSGSTVTVASGKLVVNTSTALAAPVTVKSGAMLASGGLLSSVTFEEGALVDCLPASPDTAVKYDIVTASSRPVFSNGGPAVANGAVGTGKWVARVRDNDDGTYTLYAEFVKKGFLLVVR